jgi:TolB-like protein/Flp pilus assembly protein TadD
MADIFISYSSKDREQAEQLIELLTSAGLSVWIDRSGIDVATSWSGEIVDAIEGCKAFVILLSPNSIESKNVAKEVALAAERNKKILPLDLEPVALSRDLAYHLAGIQRAPMTNIDAIIRVLGKLGLEATQAPTMKLVKETDSRKSLMILPFEDLSPTADNAWFADGIVSELISALSNVKALRVADAQATKEFKKYNGQLTTYAQTMSIRYFIQGDVRKFGDQIKISSRLLDIETGDHLWQDSMKGTMNDIFDIQEKVAEKVVEGLKVHLASDEKKKLAERGTESAEAYELYLKGNEYFLRQTKEGFQLAIQLFAEAIKLDRGFARAYQFKANALAALYRTYDQKPAILAEAETLSEEALRLKPDLFAVYQPLSHVYMHRGQFTEAEEAAREYIRKDPQNYSSHFTLGFFYMESGQPAKAIAPYEEAVRLKPDYLPILWNLVTNCDSAGEREKCDHWAMMALPYYERHLKLHPDDEGKRVEHAALLLMSGRTEDAHAAAMKLTTLKDGASLFNTACLFGKLGDPAEALRTFRRAIEARFRSIRHLKKFLTDENDGVLALQGTPEYEEVKRMVEKIEAETAGQFTTQEGIDG